MVPCQQDYLPLVLRNVFSELAKESLSNDTSYNNRRMHWLEDSGPWTTHLIYQTFAWQNTIQRGYFKRSNQHKLSVLDSRKAQIKSAQQFYAKAK